MSESETLVMCGHRLPDKSGLYKVKNNSHCNGGFGEVYFNAEENKGWEIPETIKSFYKVVGWYEYV